jgi:hypothetical protein
MAVRAYTQSDVTFKGNGAAQKITWTGLLNGDTGQPVQLPEYADRSIQVEGTFGVGGSVACEGSNDATNFRALRDPSSTTIAITAAGIKAVLENTVQTQPHVTAGDGTTSLTVTMLFHLPHNFRT